MKQIRRETWERGPETVVVEITINPFVQGEGRETVVISREAFATILSEAGFEECAP